MIAESTGPVAIREITVERTPKASWKARASEYTPMSPPSMTTSKAGGARDMDLLGRCARTDGPS